MMKAKHVNAFIEATRETFKTMCGLNFRRCGEVRKANGEIVNSDDLMTILGLSGTIRGAVMLTTPLETGMKIVSAFLQEDIKEINCDLMDGFGEIVNILAGVADAKIAEHKIDLSLPSVLVGRGTMFYANAGNPFVIIPMRIQDMGPFNLGISMEEKNN